jgi:hypothetical protein
MRSLPEEELHIVRDSIDSGAQRNNLSQEIAIHYFFVVSSSKWWERSE